MPYVDRDGKGKIKAVYARPQHKGQERIADWNDPEIVEFKNPPPSEEQLIHAKKQELIDADYRQRAIDALKSEGKLSI